MSYAVYLVSYLGALRDYYAIFVKTNADHSRGIIFGYKPAKRPEDLNSFISKSYISTVSKTNYA
ncbi:hypothetical protein COCVIDRAFT_115922 [Bipolaris victoriae FI3]|uniref:Uncharacterized protein n=1 Tax=Bipolaris victoriae (strain FI3) TaxID=930091 RepID=W7E0T4_BIPV3|nr:hypothetical protein COCVIDRAFT_115922 [Bipolaris victoriae FI3]